MDITQTPPQLVNALFTFLSQIQNTVVWVCTADYKKQLFLSDGFETIWGIPKEQMYQNMGIWMSSLYRDDLATINNAITKRNKEKNQISTLNFRIQRPENELRFLKSITYTLFNQADEPIAIIGVDENLSPEQWEQSKNTNTKTMPLLKDLSEILIKEFNLTNTQKEKNIALTKSININNKIINLTDRESQCLNYLIEGRSAKETAYYLKLSTRTVETYLDKIRSKSNCRTKIALIGKLKQQGDVFYISG